ncbi:heparinase II/III family protein [Streptomyces sp. NPDC005355]|uniref:heparinase II/III family protein n=2 Tax=unclassified Streptomyces TaxID=2593676 RepID=UPI0033B41A2D
MPVEKPPHVDETRMRQITDAALLAGLDADKPQLRAVTAAAATGDLSAALAALRGHLAGREDPAPALDTLRWAGHVAGTDAAARVIAAADGLLTGRTDFTDPAHGKSGLYAYHYLYWAQPLVHAAALTGDERYVRRFAGILDAWYASRDHVRGEWPGLHPVWYTLGVAGRSQVLIQALRVLGTSVALPDGTWLSIVKTLLGGARWLAEEHDTFRHGNWQLTGCSVLAQIAAFLPEFSESAGWAEVARARLDDHLELDVYADGGHYERTPSYHTMCLGSLQIAAVVGEQYLGWDLAAHPRFAAMHDWLLSLTAPPGWVPPFNDSHLVWSGEHLLRGHYLLGRPAYKELAEHTLSAERIREVLAWLPARPGRGAPADEFAAAPGARPPAGSALLPQSKFAVLRAEGGDATGADGLYAAVNCGPLIEHELESHSHLTAVDLLLCGYGEPLAWEAGGPDSYDDPRYHSWYRSACAHNTVTLPGEDMAEDHDAEVGFFATLPEADVLAAVHTGHGTPHRRTVIFVRPGAAGPGYWLVDDELAEAGAFQWLLHSPRPWMPSGTHRHGYRTARGPGLLVLPTEPHRVHEVRTSEGPCTVPDPAARGSAPGTLHGLAFGYDAGPAAVVLAPFRETPPPVEVTAEGQDVLVHTGPTTDRIGPGRLVRVGADGVRVAALWQGDRLEHEGRVLLAGRGITAAGLTRTADRLTVTAECRARTTLTVGETSARQVRLSGVILPETTHGAGGGPVRVVLPAAGRWTVDIERSR